MESRVKLSKLLQDAQSGKLSRRRILQGAVGLGLSAPALSGLLAACGGGDDDDDTDEDAASADGESDTGDEEPDQADQEGDADETDEPAAGGPGGTLVYGIWQNPDTLDPGASGVIATSKIAANVFDPLIYAVQDADAPYMPGLAVEWEVNDDATEYTFHLREDVTFHDGTPFTAEAVQRTFEHIVDPATQSLSAASTLNPGDVYDRTEVVDDYTVKVFFSGPNGSFLNAATTTSLAPMSPTALDEFDDVGQNPVGTGPFMFEEWVPQDHVTVVRNPDYNWGPEAFGHDGPAYLDEIVFRIIPEASTRAVALESGEIDMTEDLTPEDFTRLTEGGSYQGLRIPTTGMPYCIFINVERPPTDELAVRQALHHAVDKEAIVNTLYEGIFEPAYAPVDPTTLGFDESLEGFYPFDPDEARRLLEEAGWTEGSDGVREKDGTPLELEFINLADFGFDGIVQIMQDQYSDIGVTMNISEQSFPAVQETYQQGEHNMAPFFFFAIDPSFANSIYACDAVETFNWMHFCDEEVEELIEEGQASADPEVREPVYIELNEKIMEHAIMIPIYYKLVVLAVRESVNGFSYTTNGFPYFYDVTLE